MLLSTFSEDEYAANFSGKRSREASTDKGKAARAALERSLSVKDENDQYEVSV